MGLQLPLLCLLDLLPRTSRTRQQLVPDLFLWEDRWLRSPQRLREQPAAGARHLEALGVRCQARGAHAFRALLDMAAELQQ